MTKGEASFIEKLELEAVSSTARKLSAEMLWTLLLFQLPMSPQKKREVISQVWRLSGEELPESNYLSDGVLEGLGNPGIAYNTSRWREFRYLISLVRNFKGLTLDERGVVLSDPWKFAEWVGSVPRTGYRQFRHIIKNLVFPDTFERIATGRDKREILTAFDGTAAALVKTWTDVDIDRALLEVRRRFEAEHGAQFDFYLPPIQAQWKVRKSVVQTPDEEVAVEIPDSDLEEHQEVPHEVRKSFKIQALVARIGAEMGFRIWVPRSDRGSVQSQIPAELQKQFLEKLPLNYDDATLRTIEQIDVIWLKGRPMARAFEIEHTTAIYSGLLRMADLLALQPNMSIRLHIVAPIEKHDKVMREIKRPVFSLLEHGPLYEKCTFLSYEAVSELGANTTP